MSSCQPYSSSSFFREKNIRLSFVSKRRQYGFKSVRSMLEMSARFRVDCGRFEVYIGIDFSTGTHTTLGSVRHSGEDAETICDDAICCLLKRSKSAVMSCTSIDTISETCLMASPVR